MISDKIFKWTTHSKTKKEIIRVLENHGVHVQPIEHLGNRGVPDLNCCYQGCEFWIEIKIKPDALSSLQKKWAFLRKKAGGMCYVLYVTEDEYCLDDLRYLDNIRHTDLTELVIRLLRGLER